MPPTNTKSPGYRPPVSGVAGHSLLHVMSVLGHFGFADDELARQPNLPDDERAELLESLKCHATALVDAARRLEREVHAGRYQPIGRSDRIPP